jgi:hypothetical protein
MVPSLLGPANDADEPTVAPLPAGIAWGLRRKTVVSSRIVS